MLEIMVESQKIFVDMGSSVMNLIAKRSDAKHIYAIIFNGEMHDLRYCFYEAGVLEFVYDTSKTGSLIYDRTMHFLLIAALHEYDDTYQLTIENAISDGIYCPIHGRNVFTQKDLDQVVRLMHEMVRRKAIIYRKKVPTAEAIAFFEEQGMPAKAKLIATRNSELSSIYTLCGVHDYFYGIMLPDVSYIEEFSINFYSRGIWISKNAKFHPQPKLFEVYQNFENWGDLVHIANVAQLNKQIQDGHMNEVVLISETMIEKQLAKLADLIVNTKHTKAILIAGPSSAGKTTFSRRLSIHLKLLGKHPVAISMDNFYVNREDTPRKADGSYDFESIDALDLRLFNETVLTLLNNEPVTLPVFNFISGKREWQDKEVRLGKEDILIIEGIHGLNPKTSAYLPKDAIFKIYINALTHLNLDDHNRIPTTDYRLIRRIARDYKFRGRSASETIALRQSVQEGEDCYIYPYQEEADAIFNSSMVYELAILKKIVLPLLEEVDQQDCFYVEAKRIAKFLSYFEDGDDLAVPRHSILAEFIGNSIFDDL